IHCVLPRLSERALYASTRDGRAVLASPWREFSVVGTTDTDFEGDPDRVEATGEEVGYLLDEVRRVLPDLGAAEREVVYTYAGVRPLSFEDRARARDVARKHEGGGEGGGGLVRVTGPELTRSRRRGAQ